MVILIKNEDAIHSLKPEVIISQLPPDLPLFIRTENNY